MARRGETPKLKKRPVEVKKIKIIKYKWPDLKIKVVSGPGFYVRSLARDLGKKLKVGGYLAALERTRVGQFKKNMAIKI
jgi:tRNA pseudouridine55 synthase